MKKANPNFIEIAATEVWKARKPARVADPVPTRAWTKAARRRVELMQRRETFRIGMPRVLNMYVYAPFFSGYFESLGVPGGNLIYSDFTSGELYREGSGRGAIDPCFPAKIGIAHVHNLIFTKHAKKKLDLIFFPMVDVLHTPLQNLQGSNACPTVTVTPETVKAAFTKEADVFGAAGHRLSRSAGQLCGSQAARAAAVQRARAVLGLVGGRKRQSASKSGFRNSKPTSRTSAAGLEP